MRKPDTLEGFIDELINGPDGHGGGQFRWRGEIAREMGITDAALSQAVKGKGRGPRRLQVEACLRLAQRVKEHPAYILTLAGRHEIARVVAAIWPSLNRDEFFTRAERERTNQCRSITPSQRHHIDAVIKAFAVAAARARTGSPGGRATTSIASTATKARKPRQKK